MVNMKPMTAKELSAKLKAGKVVKVAREKEALRAKIAARTVQKIDKPSSRG
jgi:hypothetical protein